MQVFVKRNSKECDYEINIDWTVKRLKEELTQDFRIDTEKYELTHEGDPMSDNRLLMSYGLVGGSQMLLDLKPSERMKRTLKHECRRFNRAAMLNCCSKGDIKTFEEILCTGYNLEPEKNPDSKTEHFLTVAVKCRQHKMVEHLLNLGFSSNHCRLKQSFLRTTRPCPIQSFTHEYYPLKWAIINNDVRMLELLHSRGCDLDSPKSLKWESTPLLFALSKFEYFDVAKRMIALGADVTVRNSRGHSALSTAVCKGNLEAVKILMEKTSPSGPELSDLYSLATFKVVGKHTGVSSIRSLLELASRFPTNSHNKKHKVMFNCFKGIMLYEWPVDPWVKISYTFMDYPGLVYVNEPLVANGQHPHWTYLRIFLEPEEDNPDADEHFDFLHSRGNPRGLSSSRYPGSTASRKTLISKKKYQKHRALVYQEFRPTDLFANV